MNHDLIAVAMSGGVDSSTVAAMLRRDGHPIVGMTMQLWNQRRLPEVATEGAAGRCCSLDDVYDARWVANQLGIPYYVVNFEDRFEEQVVRPFVAEYLAGRTPIPCTLCNNFVKFDQFLDMAAGVGAHRVATGHYARIRHDQATGRWQLLRAADPAKDQTYFLWGLTQDQLSRTLFPLGEMKKPDVRALARELDVPTAEKHDSQEICFVPNDDYAAFLDAYLKEQGESAPAVEGDVVATDGRVLARHSGVHHFTVGQRKGLGVSAPEPLYVIATDPATQRVTVGSNDALLRASFHVKDVNWISIAPPSAPVRAEVRIRNKHLPAPATLYPASATTGPTTGATSGAIIGPTSTLTPGPAAGTTAAGATAATTSAPADPPSGPTRIEVRFDEPQRAVTPGQAAVFYSGELVLGGGWIE